MADLKIAISTDPPKDIFELTKYVFSLAQSVDFLHFDIMDGMFVNKITYTHKEVALLNACTTLPIESHLMVKFPLKHIENFAKAGSNIITVHYESFEDEKSLLKAFKLIKKSKCLVGLSIKPTTNVETIEKYLKLVDLVLIMSVQPGYSGQKFMETTYDRLTELNNIKLKNNYNFLVEVDGGICPEVVQKLKLLGVDMIVTGSYVYTSSNKKIAIHNLKKEMD